jgi:transcription initiation factor TFIIIB Brf1 subunit/transcription initiation factor TFIIB
MEKILAEINVLNLDTKVTQQCLSICERIGVEPKKGRERKMALFFAVYLAHYELGYTIIAEKLFIPLGLEKKHAAKALQTYSQELGVRTLVTTVSYTDYLKDTLDKLDLAILEEDIIKGLMLNELKDKFDELLAVYAPNAIAAACIYKYLWMINERVDKKNFVSTVGINENTMNVILRCIDKIYSC